MSLEKHTVVLRNFYTDSSVTFDAQGKLISAGTIGFAYRMGGFTLNMPKSKPDNFLLTGFRPVPLF